MNWKKYAVVCSLLLVAGCTERRRGGWTQDWQALHGDKWPLTSPGGMFHCTYFMGKVQSVAFWYKGRDYYLIPIVKKESGLYPIDLIVKPDLKNPGKKMNTDLVLEEGLKWCKQGHALSDP
ncbi:hypothetical protein QUA86_32655 [Microcoleus sp. F6_B6]